MLKNKKAYQDFSIKQLPSNRKEVFFDVLKVRTDVFIKASLLNFLFLLPLIIVLFFKVIYSNGLSYQLNENIVTSEQYASILFSSSLVFDGLLIMASLIAAIGLSGTLKIYRELVWYEPIFFKEDFFEGIKQNSALCLLLNGVLSLVYSIADIVYKSETLSTIVRYIPYGVLVVIGLPLFLYSISQISVYKTKIRQLFSNSIILFLKNALITLCFTLFIWVFTFVKLIPNTLIEFIVIGVIILIILPIFLLIWILFSYSQFDKLLNKENYPDIYRKGLIDKE